MRGKVVETTSKIVDGKVRHLLIIECPDLRYHGDNVKTQLTIPLDESGGACIGDFVPIYIGKE